jgi:Bacterial low temperature requirement A protein (LtrA)
LRPQPLEHVDLRTGAETVMMAVAVVYAWSTTAWGANWLDPDRLPVRLLLVELMFASLLMWRRRPAGGPCTGSPAAADASTSPTPSSRLRTSSSASGCSSSSRWARPC